jgi:hypothetical protein
MVKPFSIRQMYAILTTIDANVISTLSSDDAATPIDNRKSNPD